MPEVVEAVAYSDIIRPIMVLMDLLALEKACFDFIDTKRLICIELSQPEITLGGLQAIISIDRLNDSDI